jgi:hypothetical protein
MNCGFMSKDLDKKFRRKKDNITQKQLHSLEKAESKAHLLISFETD